MNEERPTIEQMLDMLMEAISYSYGYSLEGLAYPVQDKYKYIRGVLDEMKLEYYKMNSEHLNNNCLS